MDAFDVVKKLQDLSLERGKQFNGDGSDNYAYAMGHFVGNIQQMLYEILTPEQTNELNRRVAKLLP